MPLKFKDLRFIHKLFIVFIFIFLAMLSFVFVFNYNLQALLKDTSRVIHTEKVLRNLEEIDNLLLNAETGERGFIITGEDKYLVPFHTAVKKIGHHIMELREMTFDNPNQQSRINRLEKLAIDRIAELRALNSLRKKNGFNIAHHALISSNEIKKNKVKTLIDNMKKEELRLLEERIRKPEVSRKTSQKIIAALFISFIVILSITLLILHYSVAKPLKELYTGTQKVREEDFEYATNIDSNDEIGTLAKSFDYMIVTLRELHKRLVDEADENKRQAETLLRANNLMQDRESRIIELKQEINVLLSENGKKKKFSFDNNDSELFDDAPKNNIKDFPSLDKVLDKKGLQKLLDSFCKSVGIAAAIIDCKGVVFVASEWQRICTQFHRKNEKSCKNCIESDTTLAEHLNHGDYCSLYTCRNLLTDAASPIIVNGQHIANFFIGQFLLNSPDMEAFRKQALKFNFNEKEYLDALKEVPVFSREQIKPMLEFITSLGEYLSESGLGQLQLSDYSDKISQRHLSILSLAEDLNEKKIELENEIDLRLEAEEKLRLIAQQLSTTLNSINDGIIATDINGVIIDMNPASERLTGWKKEKALNHKLCEVFKIIDEATSQETECPVLQVLSSGKNSELENNILLMPLDKAPIHISATASPIFEGVEKLTGAVLSFKDETDKYEKEAQIRNNEKRLRTVFESMEEVIYVSDPDSYELLFVNSAFEKYWGKDVIGKKCHKILQNSDVPCEFCSNRHIFGTHSNDSYIWEFQNPLNQRWYRCIDRAIEWFNGKIVRFEMAIDITDRKQMEQKLHETNKALDEFAYIVSHDLKAPLRGISSLATWLNEDYKDKLDEDGVENLTLLQDRVDKMNKMIDGILKYSRLGKSGLEIKNVNLDELLIDIIELLDVPHGIDIKTVSTLPVISTDEVIMRQILQNLIQNAIKHAGKPSVNIEIGCAKNDDGNYKFHVRDDGVGIRKEDHEKIFKMFQTGYAKTPKDSTGIGLALIKKAISLLGGKIWIDDTTAEGNGACFYFTIADMKSKDNGKI